MDSRLIVEKNRVGVISNALIVEGVLGIRNSLKEFRDMGNVCAAVACPVFVIGTLTDAANGSKDIRRCILAITRAAVSAALNADTYREFQSISTVEEFEANYDSLIKRLRSRQSPPLLPPCHPHAEHDRQEEGEL